MTQTFIVEARYTPSGRWALRSENGAFSQCRRFDQIEDEMREPIAYLAGIPEEDVRIEIKTVLDPEREKEITQALSLRAEQERVAERAREATRHAAKSLVASGMPMRDVGTLLGITHQRVSQLVNA